MIVWSSSVKCVAPLLKTHTCGSPWQIRTREPHPHTYPVVTYHSYWHFWCLSFHSSLCFALWAVDLWTWLWLAWGLSILSHYSFIGPLRLESLWSSWFQWTEWLVALLSPLFLPGGQVRWLLYWYWWDACWLHTMWVHSFPDKVWMAQWRGG